MFGRARVINLVLDGKMKAEKLCELLEIISLITARCSYITGSLFENSDGRLTTYI